MATLIKGRIVRAVTAGVLATVVTSAGSSCASDSGRGEAFCAFMPDAIGLYVGNPVTQMGYQIGTVTSIQPSAPQVRVEFSLTEKRQIPVDVKAIIRSPSILADRSLELVGNYGGGAQLEPAGCIALERSMSPKTLSEVIGSADTFLNAINAGGSENVADSVRGLDQLSQGNGAGMGRLLTISSALLDSPDQSISDIGSITRNVAELSSALVEMREPMKQILQDSVTTTPDLAVAIEGAARLAGPDGYGTLGPLTEMVAVLETRLGDETQITLDSVSAAVRKTSPHANALAGLLDPVPWWINSAANHFNAKQFGIFNIAYRPPLFRVRTHDGLALCGAMNASMPGSCADVNGQPFAVDVALLQYVLQQASHP